MTLFRIHCLAVSVSVLMAAAPASAQETDQPTDVELPDEGKTEPGAEAPAEEAPAEEAPPEETPPQQEPQAQEAPPAQPASPPPQQPAPAPSTQQTMPPAPAAQPAQPPPDTTAPTDAKQPQLMQGPQEDEKEEEEIFTFFTVVPEVGYIFFPKSQMTVNGFTATVEARNGFVGKLHLDIGGDGLAFELAPLFAVEAGGITQNGSGFGSGVDLSQGLASGNMQAIGGQLALVYRFELGYFFPNIGVSFHGTYMFGNEIEYGTELYGRIPVGFTVYMGKHVGFVFEAGFMYGVTGIRTPFKMPEVMDSLPSDVQSQLETAQTPEDFEQWYYDNQDDIDEWLQEQKDNNELPEDYSSDQMAADFAADQLAEQIHFGQGFGIDLTIGIRFP